MEPMMVSIAEASRILGLGKSSVYVLIKDQRLEMIKIGRRTLLTMASVRRIANPAHSP